MAKTGSKLRLAAVALATVIAPISFIALQILTSERTQDAARLAKYFRNVAPLILLLSIALSGVTLFAGSILTRHRQLPHPGGIHIAIASATAGFLGLVASVFGGGGVGSVLAFVVFTLAGAIWSLPVAVTLELAGRRKGPAA